MSLLWSQAANERADKFRRKDPGRAYSASQGMEALADYSCRSVHNLEHPNLQRVFVNRVLPKA